MPTFSKTIILLFIYYYLSKSFYFPYDSKMYFLYFPHDSRMYLPTSASDSRLSLMDTSPWGEVTVDTSPSLPAGVSCVGVSESLRGLTWLVGDHSRAVTRGKRLGMVRRGTNFLASHSSNGSSRKTTMKYCLWGIKNNINKNVRITLRNITCGV